MLVLMDYFLNFAALISAFTWAITSVVFKTINLKNVLSFPFYEAIVSFLLLSVFITFFYGWDLIFRQNLDSLFIFVIGTSTGCIGFICYVISIRKIPIGIALTLSACSSILTILLLDYFLNLFIYNWLVLFGSFLILMSIFLLNFEYIFSNTPKMKNSSYSGMFYSLAAGLIWGFATYLNDLALNHALFVDAALARTIVWVILPSLITICIRRNFDFIPDNKVHSFKIILAAILATVSTFFWFIALNRTTGFLSVIMSNSAPIFALIIGYVFLREKISKYQTLGIFISFSGILIVIMFR